MGLSGEKDNVGSVHHSELQRDQRFKTKVLGTVK